MIVRRVLRQLLQWICAVPVFGFNFQRYDLTVLKSPLIRRLVCVDTGDGGDGDDNNNDNGDNDNNDSNGTTSCSGSDSGDSDCGEAGN